MNRIDIIKLARKAGIRSATILDLYGMKMSALTDSEILEVEAIERFAMLVSEHEAAKFAKGVKISIPSITLEQEFSKHHRLGYKAGAAAARESCAKLCEEYTHGQWLADAIREMDNK